VCFDFDISEFSIFFTISGVGPARVTAPVSTSDTTHTQVEKKKKKIVAIFRTLPQQFRRRIGYDANTSLGYSQATGIHGGESKKDDTRQYFDGSQEGSYAGLAICEIVKDAVHDHGWCFTVSDEDAIMTRYFFVYTNSADVAKAGPVKVSDKDFEAELRALIAAS
jgi:hypothetical protein